MWRNVRITGFGQIAVRRATNESCVARRLKPAAHFATRGDLDRLLRLLLSAATALVTTPAAAPSTTPSTTPSTATTLATLAPPASAAVTTSIASILEAAVAIAALVVPVESALLLTATISAALILLLRTSAESVCDGWHAGQSTVGRPAFAARLAGRGVAPFRGFAS